VSFPYVLEFLSLAESLELVASLCSSVPRPEDWPVMPYEDVHIAFKPVSFFKANPSLDVPATVDEKSVHALGGGGMPMSDAKENGKSCCK